MSLELEETYSENAKRIYKRLYLTDNETIQQCHARIANYLADDYDEAQIFCEIQDTQAFRANTPAMTNAGTKRNANLAACFILGLEDDMKSITEMWQICSFIYEGGGGAGLPITNLREKDAPISTGGFASGPLSYLNVNQTISDTVKSGGRSRRAANLVSAWYEHPDIFDIINCKRDKVSYKSMNFSILVDECFMNAVRHIENDIENGSDPRLFIFKPISPKSGTLDKSFSVKETWDNIIEATWSTGDPGLLFYERLNEDNPFPSRGNIHCTNPCGEVPGIDWTCCNLGHLNLTKFVKNSPHRTGTINIDWESLNHHVKAGVEFLNKIIDKNHYINEKFKSIMLTNRPIGLGIMGFSDLCFMMKIRYGSKESVDLLGRIMRFITKKAFEASLDIGMNNPEACIKIPNEDLDHFNDYVKKFADIRKDNLKYLANSTVTVIAPTGSTSISADCSYSFEPEFGLVWDKVLENGERMSFLNKYFKDALIEHGIKIDNNLIERIRKNNGSIQGFNDIPQELQNVFVTAHDVHWKDRLELNAAAQHNTTMSVSSTINLPKPATIDDVKQIYLMAWIKGLKGITIYRDGCLHEQPVDFGTKEENPKEVITEHKSKKKIERPQRLIGVTEKMMTGSGTLYLTVNEMDGKPFEVFATLAKSGRSAAAKAESLGRMTSLCLRSGITVKEIVKQLEGIGGDYQIYQQGGLIKSIPDAIARILRDMYLDDWNDESSNPVEDINEMVEKTKNETDHMPHYEICPRCGRFSLVRGLECRGGTCINMNCGYSNC